MKSDILLFERFANLIDADTKAEYVDEIWDMMEAMEE